MREKAQFIERKTDCVRDGDWLDKDETAKTFFLFTSHHPSIHLARCPSDNKSVCGILIHLFVQILSNISTLQMNKTQRLKLPRILN